MTTIELPPPNEGYRWQEVPRMQFDRTVPDRRFSKFLVQVPDEAWEPGDVIRDDNGDLYWRAWDNESWVFMLMSRSSSSRKNHLGKPIRPFTHLLRDNELFIDPEDCP